MPNDALNLDTIGLFLDVDGTLLDLAARPMDVDVPRRLLDDLSALSIRLDGALALVSGRSVAVLDELFEPLRLKAAGSHGAELRLEAEGEVEIVSAGLPAALREELEELSANIPGVLIEDKAVCVAVHYREAPTSADALRAALETMLNATGDASLEILPGRLVFEVKHRSHDKGTAVDAFMERPPFRGRRPVFIGDDITDEAGFAVVPKHGGLAYAVGRDMRGAKRGFDTASEVRAWIARLAGREEAAA